MYVYTAYNTMVMDAPLCTCSCILVLKSCPWKLKLELEFQDSLVLGLLITGGSSY